MNFEFSEEQTMIKDSVSRFVREQYDFDTRRGIIESDDGISREFWSMFAELGWLSVPFAPTLRRYWRTSAPVWQKWRTPSVCLTVLSSARRLRLMAVSQ